MKYFNLFLNAASKGADFEWLFKKITFHSFEHNADIPANVEIMFAPVWNAEYRHMSVTYVDGVIVGTKELSIGMFDRVESTVHVTRHLTIIDSMVRAWKSYDSNSRHPRSTEFKTADQNLRNTIEVHTRFLLQGHEHELERVKLLLC